jgi:hypothetical protein
MICRRHRYWESVGQSRRIQDLDFYKRVAMVGRRSSLSVTGDGHFGFDGRR